MEELASRANVVMKFSTAEIPMAKNSTVGTEEICLDPGS